MAETQEQQQQQQAEEIIPPSSSNQENIEGDDVAATAEVKKKTTKKKSKDVAPRPPPPVSTRPKRKASQNIRNSSRSKSKVKPSSSMYVGYVEEDETPEMIMAKFAELERIQQMHKEKQEQLKLEKKMKLEQQQAQEKGEGGEILKDITDGKNNEKIQKDGEHEQEREQETSDNEEEEEGLTEEQLREVFRATSAFTMRKAMKAEDAAMFGFDELERDFYKEYDDEDMEQYDDEDAEFWEMMTGKRRWPKALKAKKGPREPREPREPKAPREPKPQKSHMITAYNSDTGFMIRKKKFFDPRELNIFKLPKHDLPNDPLPITWGRAVKPFVPKDVREKELAAVPDCTQLKMKIDKNMDFSKLAKDYLGILMNPPWNIDQAPDKGNVTVEDIAQLPLETLTPLGFIFIWVEKENLSLVCDVMQEKNFNYVENLTWVQMQPNNVVVGTESRYLARSHRTLLIFRRSVSMFPEGKAIELRHQRNSDVTLDVVETTKAGRRKIPEHVYNSIETLLPTAYNKKNPGTPGKFLELWAEEGNKRAGWTSIVDTP
jgi:N6-adenosine-specific RNA methylase IME4